MLRGTEIRPDMTMQVAWGQDGWPTSFTVEVDDGNEDEMVLLAESYPKKSSTSPLLLGFARRIREACGVTEQEPLNRHHGSAD